MISGVSVTVTKRVPVVDTLGNPVYDEMGELTFTTSATTVANVLWHEANTDEMDESNRAYGVTCDISMSFPKTYTDSLEGCTVTVGGKNYRVLGDPIGYMPENTPTPWNRTVMAVRADG